MKSEKVKKRRKMSYERKKALYGFLFILPWLIGALAFFIIPTLSSFRDSFYNITLGDNGYVYEFVGLANYAEALFYNATYIPNLLKSVIPTILKTPFIISLSLFIAILLNQNFRGRTVARAIFFLPVLIATGPVLMIITGNAAGDNPMSQVSTMFSVSFLDGILSLLGLSSIGPRFTAIITAFVDNIFSLIWLCGIQILIFLAALQGVPQSSKEAAVVEGATNWEFFWKITFPLISPMIIVALVYTIIDSFVASYNPVMQQVTELSNGAYWGLSSAMLWIYVAIVLTVLGIAVFFCNKFVFYEDKAGGG